MVRELSRIHSQPQTGTCDGGTKDVHSDVIGCSESINVNSETSNIWQNISTFNSTFNSSYITTQREMKPIYRQNKDDPFSSVIWQCGWERLWLLRLEVGASISNNYPIKQRVLPMFQQIAFLRHFPHWVRLEWWIWKRSKHKQTDEVLKTGNIQ